MLQAETKVQSPSPCMRLLSSTWEKLPPLAGTQVKDVCLCHHMIPGINLSLRLLDTSLCGDLALQPCHLLKKIKLDTPASMTPLPTSVPSHSRATQRSGQLSQSSGGPPGCTHQPRKIVAPHVCFCFSLSAMLGDHRVGIHRELCPYGPG